MPPIGEQCEESIWGWVGCLEGMDVWRIGGSNARTQMGGRSYVLGHVRWDLSADSKGKGAGGYYGDFFLGGSFWGEGVPTSANSASPSSDTAFWYEI